MSIIINKQEKEIFKWKDFKDAIENMGIKDDTDIVNINTNAERLNQTPAPIIVHLVDYNGKMEIHDVIEGLIKGS